MLACVIYDFFTTESFQNKKGGLMTEASEAFLGRAIFTVSSGSYTCFRDTRLGGGGMFRGGAEMMARQLSVTTGIHSMMMPCLYVCIQAIEKKIKKHIEERSLSLISPYDFGICTNVLITLLFIRGNGIAA